MKTPAQARALESDWYAVRVDETGHCEPEFVARCGGKVWTVYIYNRNESNYCCEMTPSFCLYEIECQPETWPEDERDKDRLAEELLECVEYEVRYYHWHDVLSMGEQKHLGHYDSDEAAEEDARCNSPF